MWGEKEGETSGPFPQEEQLSTSFTFLFKDFMAVHAKIEIMLRYRKFLGNELIFKHVLTYVYDLFYNIQIMLNHYIVKNSVQYY